MQRTGDTHKDNRQNGTEGDQDRRSGEGSRSALARLKKLERAKAKVRGNERPRGF